MSGSRKRGSKWDSKEERQYSLENVRDGAWPAKAGMPFHDREPERGYYSQEVGRNGKKWSADASDMMKLKHGLPSRESLPGNRGGQKDDNINVDGVKNWKSTAPWDGDESYSMKMSPGLDEWRQQNRRHSPRSDWSRSHSFTHRSRSRSWSRSRSRSRSRSPVRGVRRQSGFHERTRSRSGASSQLCQDFMAGRCRRGSQCHFLHEDIQSHEDGWDNRQKRSGASKYFTPVDGKDYLIKTGRSTDCCTDYLKGNCRRGASCRFVHDGASDAFNRGSINEVSRERESNKRNRVATPERDAEREARRSSDIPCKYFAAGNCRNGKYCRFSHHVHSRASPERRSRGERGGWGQSSVSEDKLQDGAKLRDADASFNAEKSWNAQKWNDADASNEAVKSWAGPKWSDANASNDVDKSWTDPKWSDTCVYSGAAKLSKDTNGKIGASEPRFSNWSPDERWQHDYDVRGKNIETNMHYKTVDIDKNEAIPRKIENAAVSLGMSEPKGAEESLGDMEMSPEWNYTSSVKNEHSHNSKSIPVDTPLPAHEENITEEASHMVRDGLAASQPMSTEKSSFQQDHMVRGSTAVALPCHSIAVSRNSSVPHIDLNYSTNILPMPSFDQPGLSSSSLPYLNVNAVGQSQVVIPSNEVNMKVIQNSLLFQEEKPINKLNMGDTNILHGNSGTQSTQNMVSNEQLTQLTNLSASLAQLFGKGQQLPSVHLALNAHDQMQVIPNSGGPVEPDSIPTIQREKDITVPKQYDPISDSIEPVKKQDTDTKTLGFSIHPFAQKNTADGKPETSSLVGSTNGVEYHNDHNSKRDPDFDSREPNKMETVASSEVTKENGGVEETKKAEEEETKNGPPDNVDADDKTDEGKKSKDGKGIRAFKFALVEFVKDLLKPTWKEGQIGKEAYKNIVKKVVDKVTATMQGTNIPQTPEKIDQYLSVSKPKLSKLVQAYVEKFQKS